ncbi:DUF1398 domain-containing protein [Flavobacterium selenitireducens]|uniref:DUF1398 domain-containing protein n=1 Tax=Flavobacterium selenitireducens TaxID=2722704 RepID=UPI00168C0A01|nr:DUF1398 family protein [Flavobacterium selenitireducens]MBD3583112.1 DUF1398 family protein [Flavobacterium selenitireducens]
MFTIDQIQSAHSKVKSGADFPAYLREIEQLGVASYTIAVRDGSANYFGNDGFSVSAGPKYPNLEIATVVDRDRFLSDLKAHQQGLSDYSTFCEQSARSGVSKWTVDIEKLTCAYFDSHDREILIEKIPG